MIDDNLVMQEGRIKLHLLKSTIFAVPLYAIFYVFVFFINVPFSENTKLYVLFYETGLMPHLCTLATTLSLLLLFFRWLENKQEYKAINIVESHLATVGRIGKDNADQLLLELEKNSAFTSGQITYSRFSRLMRHVKTGSSWAETESLVKGMSTNDIDALESSFSWVRFLIWFIPILGFIGTVIGIGEAIGGFNTILTSTVDFNAMKGSLGGITDSLAYAFDSTLVALFQDALIMFILSLVQKQGDDLIVTLDEIFTDDVLVRVEHVEQSGGMGVSKEMLSVFERFSESAKELTSLAKLDSFEKTFMDIKDALVSLNPILANLQKKRSLHFKLEELEE